MDLSPTKLEVALSQIAPMAAARRYNTRMMMSGAYSATTRTRYRKTNAYGRARSGSEDRSNTSRDRMTLILEGQDLMRNSPVVRGAVNRFMDYAVDDGIKPVALTSDDAWNRLAEDYWNDIVSPTIDYRQQTDMVGIDRLTLGGRM